MDKDSFTTKEIGNYRLVEKLACGSFGCVYKAEHIHLKKLIVAIKMLHVHLSYEEAYTQFIQEAQFLEMLKHPSILPIRDMGILNKQIPYLVLEYCSEGSLRKRLTQLGSRPLPLEEAISIISNIGQGLHFAHLQNVVHRDLKPENILFNSEGKALLADFSIAVLLESTKLIDNFGTPPYMAPELFQGETSKKSDQYALGCITYELMTGKKPFTLSHDAPAVAWANIHATKSPVPPRNLNPNIPKHVEQAILRSLEKQRNDRFENISAFIDALCQSVQQRPVKIRNPFNPKWYEETTVGNKQAIQLSANNPNSTTTRDEPPNMHNQSEASQTASVKAIHPEANEAIAKYRESVSLYNLHRDEEALAASDQAIHLDPNNAKTHYLKGRILYELKRYGEALAASDQAIHLDPNNANAHYSKGLTLYELKRYGEALAAFEQAIHLDPNNAKTHYLKGRILYELKRNEEALAAYDQAIYLDHKLVNAYIAKGNALKELKRYREVLSTYDQAIQFNPQVAEIYGLKGEALFDLKRYKEALSMYEQAIHLAPKSTWLYTAKGRTLWYLSSKQEVIKAYEQVILVCDQAIWLDEAGSRAYEDKGDALEKLDQLKNRDFYNFIFICFGFSMLLILINILLFISIPFFHNNIINHLGIANVPITIGLVIATVEWFRLYDKSNHIFIIIVEYIVFLTVIPLVTYFLFGFLTTINVWLYFYAFIVLAYLEFMFTYLFFKKLIIQRKLKHIDTEKLHTLY